MSGQRIKTAVAVLVVLLLTVSVGAGIYYGVNRQQNIRSKAAEFCSNARWPADPNTACGQATQQPAQGATNVSLTPAFHWDYGGYRTGETGCVQPIGTNCVPYSAAVYLWEGDGSGALLARCGLPESSSPVKDAPFSCFGIGPLKPNTRYTWRVTPYYAGTVHAEQTWNYNFTTGAGTPTTPDCTSLTTTANLNALQIGQTYTFDLKTGGGAPVTSAEMSVHSGGVGTCGANITDLKPYAPQSGSGPNFTFTWTPTKVGSFTAYGRVWNDSIAECRADCVDGPPRYACAGSSACRLTGTVLPPSPIICGPITLSPNSQTITSSGETRQITQGASGQGTTYYSWSASGGTLSSTNTRTITWTAPALGTSSQTWTITGKVWDSRGPDYPGPSGTCTQTLTYTYSPPPPVAACQRVITDKNLSSIKVGDTVKFTGFGSITNPATGDSIDKIKFILIKDGAVVSSTDVNTTLDSMSETTKTWAATQSATISDGGSYSMQIQTHRASDNSWLQ